MNTLLDLLSTYVSSTGLVVPGTDFFLDHLPGEPLACTALILTGGPYDPGNAIRRETFQVLVRNPDAYTARTLANSIHALFNDVFSDRTSCQVPGWEGRLYPQHEPGPHFLDENNNTIYTLNYVFETVRGSS